MPTICSQLVTICHRLILRINHFREVKNKVVDYFA